MIEYLCDLKVVIAVVTIISIYLYETHRQNLHKKLGNKGPTPLPFIGNMLSILYSGVHDFDKTCRKKFGKIYPIYFGRSGMSIVSDEELLKQILIKEFKCFTDRLDIGFETKVTKKMLNVLKGKDWERVRNLITPTFTSGKLKKMSPLFTDCLDLLYKRLNNCKDGEPVDVKEFFGALTMDTIARTMFGMKIDSQTNPNNLFILNAKKLFSVSIRNPINILLLTFPILIRLMMKIYPNWELSGVNTIGFFDTNIRKAIEERRSSTERYTDFLALMLKKRKEEKEEEAVESQGSNTKYLTPEEIVAQSLIFLIVGYESTASTLTFVSYYLAKNRNIQQQLYEELIDVIGIDGEVTYDSLMKMPLLDAAINETMRICPSALRFERTCTKDIDLVTSDNRIIHAQVGDVFTVPIYAIHTDPAIWPDPDVFDITRWTQEAKKDRSVYAFLPFGIGPRNCVAMRFALVEIKWALSSILKNFEMVPCEETIETMQFRKAQFSQTSRPIILKIQKRQ